MHIGLSNDRDGERGATAVEFAVVTSILLVLVFGIFEFGLAFNDYLSVRFGSQEGARQAIVGTTGSDSGCPLTGAAASAGVSTRQLLCLTKDRVGLDEADTRVKIAFGSSGYVEQGYLVVCVQYPLEGKTGLFTPLLSGKQVKAQTRSRIEELASPALQATSETAPSGGDWDWCSAQ